MNSSKEKASVKKGFERKQVNGKNNPKYVDLLEEDKPLAGQKFVCVSFVSPENIIKQKQIFFFEQFLKKWDLNKSMEKFVQFLNFVSFKYNVSFDDISNDFKEFVKEEKDNLLKTTMEDDYKTFVDNNEESLDKDFGVAHNFQTSTRGLKIRGSYPTIEEAELRCKMLREIDPNHDIMVGPVGMWMPWEPEAYKTGRVEYMEEELNQLMSEKNKNESNAKTAFDQRVKESKKKAIEENIKNAEKSGNSLTQSIDEQGNLIGVNNANTQEFGLKDKDNISSADIQMELFEGENIVVGKTDNGQSQLVSGPFATKKDSMEQMD
jgi:vacuolar-type H+-ATPase subunit I/STV1